MKMLLFILVTVVASSTCDGICAVSSHVGKTDTAVLEERVRQLETRLEDQARHGDRVLNYTQWVAGSLICVILVVALFLHSGFITMKIDKATDKIDAKFATEAKRIEGEMERAHHTMVYGSYFQMGIMHYDKREYRRAVFMYALAYQSTAFADPEKVKTDNLLINLENCLAKAPKLSMDSETDREIHQYLSTIDREKHGERGEKIQAKLSELYGKRK